VHLFSISGTKAVISKLPLLSDSPLPNDQITVKIGKACSIDGEKDNCVHDLGLDTLRKYRASQKEVRFQ
jgi:hypothetical protein